MGVTEKGQKRGGVLGDGAAIVPSPPARGSIWGSAVSSSMGSPAA